MSTDWASHECLTIKTIQKPVIREVPVTPSSAPSKRVHLTFPLFWHLSRLTPRTLALLHLYPEHNRKICGFLPPPLFLVFIPKYTGCPRRNGQNFGRVFLMLNYTGITQNTYIQSWTVTEIMAIEKCGCPRTVRRPWRHTHPLRMPGNQTPLASIVMQW